MMKKGDTLSLPKGWEISEFEKCLEKVTYTNKIQKKDFKEQGNYPIISQEQDFINGYWNNEADLFKIQKPIVIFGDHTQVKKYVDFDFVLGADGVKIFQTKNNIDPKYFYYFLQNVVSENLGYARHYRLLKEISVAYPKSIEEQQHIVSILDKCFAAIDKVKANAEQNFKNAKELFESYLQGVFEKSSWEMKKWGELCEFVRGPFGGSLKKNIFKESGYVVYEQKHAIHDHFNQLRYFIDEEKFNEMKRFELFPGDIIMSCSGATLGSVAVVPMDIPRGIINQALLKLTPKKGVSADFLKHWLRSKVFQEIIFRYSGGAAIPNVPSAKILKDIKIPCPTIREQERIVNEIEIVFAETQKLEAMYQKKIADLDELKKSILQKAFSGELTEKGVVI